MGLSWTHVGCGRGWETLHFSFLKSAALFPIVRHRHTFAVEASKYNLCNKNVKYNICSLHFANKSIFLPKHQECHSSVFISKFEQILHIGLVLASLTSNK